MPIVWTDNPAANELLETDPLALLIGLVLDQQVKIRRVLRKKLRIPRAKCAFCSKRS